MPPMMIVDSQIHIWAPETPDRPWPAERAGHPQRPLPFSAQDALAEMDAAGVDAAILVPPSWEGDRNDVALAAAQAWPDRFAVMGRIDFSRPDWADHVADWRAAAGLAGFRLTFHTPALAARLDDPEDVLWQALVDADAPVMLSLPGKAAKAGPVARRHPGLRLAIDHCALPAGRKDEEAFAQLDDLIALAAHGNVAVKLSALPCYTTHRFPFPPLHEPVLRLIDAFGADRLFWGSDLTRLPGSYADCLRFFAEALPVAADMRERLLGRALCDWLGWRPS